MLKPLPPTQTICPMCGEPGVHSTTQQCIDTLVAAIKKARAAIIGPIEPSIKHLGHYVPSFVP